jgi:CRP-like cAMP-binding protein
VSDEGTGEGLSEIELERFGREPVFDNIPDTERRHLAALCRRQTLRNGAFFLREGDAPDRVAYVGRGLFRVFFVTTEGEERTMAFRSAGRLLSGYTSSLERSPAAYSIQAIEDSVLYWLPLSAIPDLLARHPCWTELATRYAQLLFMEKERREREFLSLGAEARYAAFLEHYPGLEKRIPQYLVASFLGISPVTLSRIRKGSTRR